MVCLPHSNFSFPSPLSKWSWHKILKPLRKKSTNFKDILSLRYHCKLYKHSAFKHTWHIVHKNNLCLRAFHSCLRNDQISWSWSFEAYLPDPPCFFPLLSFTAAITQELSVPLTTSEHLSPPISKWHTYAYRCTYEYLLI